MLNVTACCNRRHALMQERVRHLLKGVKTLGHLECTPTLITLLSLQPKYTAIKLIRKTADLNNRHLLITLLYKDGY